MNQQILDRLIRRLQKLSQRILPPFLNKQGKDLEVALEEAVERDEIEEEVGILRNYQLQEDELRNAYEKINDLEYELHELDPNNY